jgi:hypothetical protein
VVPPDSHGISRAPCYLGYSSGVRAVSSTGVLPSVPGLSHALRLRRGFLTPRQLGRTDRQVPQPRPRNACRLSHVIGLASSAFARHYSRNHRLFSLPVGTEMFHFPTFPPHALCVQAWVTGHDSCRVSPFGHPRITARLAAPRGLSQPPTSFFGSWCQGIHRAPLITWPQRLDARVHCAVLKVRARPRPSTVAAPAHASRPTRTGPNRRKTLTRPIPQDPTACQAAPPRPHVPHHPEERPY